MDWQRRQRPRQQQMQQRRQRQPLATGLHTTRIPPCELLLWGWRRPEANRT